MKGPLELIHNGTVKLGKFLGWITKYPWRAVWAIVVMLNLWVALSAASEGQYDEATFHLLVAWFFWWIDAQ